MRRLKILALIALAATASQVALAAPNAEVERITSSRKFVATTEAMDQDYERMIAEIITLTEIPAPPFKENVRAAAYMAMMKDAGLSGVHIDGIGNVIGIRPGADRSLPPLVVSAHLDTVFPEGTDVKVRREGTRLLAPGVSDDTSALVELLVLNRAMDKAKLTAKRDIIFVGDVGEEGLGNLRGIRHFFENYPGAKKAAGYITIDSAHLEAITTLAVGSRRYKINFSGPGGHSYAAFGTVNPLVALANTVRGLYDIQLAKTGRDRSTYSASVVGGGVSVNTIPNKVFLEVDIRSGNADSLMMLDQQLRGIVERSVAAENATRDTSTGKISAVIDLSGERPVGHTDETSALVTGAQYAIAKYGFNPRFVSVSNDSTIAMNLGIPAIGIGSAGAADYEHTLQEYLDVDRPLVARGLQGGLATILLWAGGIAK